MHIGEKLRPESPSTREENEESAKFNKSGAGNEARDLSKPGKAVQSSFGRTETEGHEELLLRIKQELKEDSAAQKEALKREILGEVAKVRNSFDEFKLDMLRNM